ncbi:MAG: hypothetical protein ACFBZ8_11885 [Opitutales bacterium]
MNCWLHRLLATLLFAGLAALHGQPTSTALGNDREAVEDSQLIQESLRQRTQEIIRQLDAIILEYERNGITGADLEELRQTRQLLAENSIEAMREVVRRLERAQYARSNSVALAFLVRAFEGQQGILNDFRDLLDLYNQKRDTALVPVILLELAERQRGNLDSAINLARTVRPKRALSEFERASIDAQYEEQRDIGQQFNFIVSTMEILASGNDPEVAPLYRAALLRMQQAQTVGVLAQALQALGDEQVFSAVSLEKKAHEQLLALARFLTPPRPVSEQLRDLAARVRALIQGQTEVRDRAQAQLDQQRHTRNLGGFQGDLVVDAAQILSEAQTSAADAVPPLQQAIGFMQETRARLVDNDPVQRGESLQFSVRAIEKLEEVLALLNDAAASAAAQEQLAADTTQPEILDDFARKLQQLIAIQTELNRTTEILEQSGASLQGAIPEQERIRGLTAFLENEARTVAPTAAPLLALATQKMRDALAALPIDARARIAIERQREALALLQQAAEQTTAEQAEQPELLARNDPEDGEALDPEALDDAEEALDAAQEAAENAEENLAEGDTEEAIEDIEEGLEALDEAADTDGSEQADEGSESDASDKAELEDNADPQDAENAESQDNPTEPGEDALDDPQADSQNPDAEVLPDNPQPGIETDESATPTDSAEATTEGDTEESEAEAAPEETAEDDQNNLPAEAEEAIEEAREALDAAREAAEAGDEAEAQQNVQEAVEAIERAQDVIDEAQQNTDSEELLAEIEAELTDPQKSTEGTAFEAEDESELAENQNLEGDPSEAAEDDPTQLAQNSEDPQDRGDLTSTGERTQSGRLRSLGDGAYTALPERDRAAIEQSLSEEYPEAYEAFIQQYRENLAEATR